MMVSRTPFIVSSNVRPASGDPPKIRNEYPVPVGNDKPPAML